MNPLVFDQAPHGSLKVELGDASISGSSTKILGA
jgi:hypothetical protein